MNEVQLTALLQLLYDFDACACVKELWQVREVTGTSFILVFLNGVLLSIMQYVSNLVSFEV